MADLLTDRLAEAASWLRTVQKQRDEDERRFCASGMTYSQSVLADAEKALDDVLAAHAVAKAAGETQTLWHSPDEEPKVFVGDRIVCIMSGRLFFLVAEEGGWKAESEYYDGMHPYDSDRWAYERDVIAARADADARVQAAVQSEREACEQLAWHYAGNIALGDQMQAAEWIAAAIRARGPAVDVGRVWRDAVEQLEAKASGETAQDAFGIAHKVTKFLFDAGYVVQGADLKIVALETEKIIGKRLAATKAAGETANPKDDVFHPSECIRDECAARGWSLADLAREMGGDIKKNLRALDRYNSGGSRVVMDVGTAQKIGSAFGTGSEFWLNLQKDFFNRLSAKAAQETAADFTLSDNEEEAAEQLGMGLVDRCQRMERMCHALAEKLAAARADADARVQAAVQELDNVWREAIRRGDNYSNSDETVSDILAEVARRTGGAA